MDTNAISSLPQVIAKPKIQNTWLRLVIFIFIWIISCTIFYTCILAIYPNALAQSKTEFEKLMTNYDFIFLNQIVILLGTFTSILFMTRTIEKRSFSSVGTKFNTSQFLSGILFGFIIISSFVIILSISGYITFYFRGLSIEIFYLLILYILIAVSEEIFFRGYILNVLAQDSNKLIAILISSLIFGAFHILNSFFGWVGFINITLSGFLMAILYLKNKNLSFPIGLHLSWNFFQGPIFGFAVSGHETSGLFQIKSDASDYLTGGDFGAEGSVLLIPITSLAILCFLKKT